MRDHDIGAKAGRVVANVLGIEPASIDPRTPLALYGLDSLNSMQVVAALEDAFSQSLPEWLLTEYSSLDTVSRAIGGASSGIIPFANGLADTLNGDAILPDDIQPLAGRLVERPRHILLTGATGFLGAYLLRSLLAHTTAVVHCLIRGGPSDAAARLRRNLAQYGLADLLSGGRVRSVEGDLTAARLGLTGEYSTLCESVDAIYHAAADVNWVLPYAALRRSNVLVLHDLLRIAGTARPKALHFVSSLSVCHAVGESIVLSEDADLAHLVDRLPLGYAQSKCVAESLVSQAAARGFTTTVFRPSLIGGDSVAGASNLDDVVAALLKGCIAMRTAPDLDWTLDLTPVDHVADTIVRLSRSKPASLARMAPVHHISNASPRSWRECVLWANARGFPMTLLSYDDWRSQLERDSLEVGHPLHRLRSFFLRQVSGGLTLPELYQDGRCAGVDSSHSQQCERRLGLHCPALDADLLDRYVANYIERGFLPRPQRHDRTPRRSSATAAPKDMTRRLEQMLRHHTRDSTLRILSDAIVLNRSANSLLGELTTWRSGRDTGVTHRRLLIERSGSCSPLDLTIKRKASDDDTLAIGEDLAMVCDPSLADALRAHREQIGIRGMHLRELAIYDMAQDDPRFSRYLPQCLGTWRDDKQHDWGLALEHLDGMAVLDALRPAQWSPGHIRAAIEGLADIHGLWSGKTSALVDLPWMGHIRSTTSAVKMIPLWSALARHAAPAFRAFTDPSLPGVHERLVQSISAWWPHLDAIPQTLIHNDFNPRNVALRHDGDGLRLCAYDWELATVGCPTRDLAEFLCFVLEPDVDTASVAAWVELHRQRLQQSTACAIDAEQWRASFASALNALLIDRLGFYTMIHRVRPQAFLPRVVQTWFQIYRLWNPRQAPNQHWA